jgi:hypothetical protein
MGDRLADQSRVLGATWRIITQLPWPFGPVVGEALRPCDRCARRYGWLREAEAAQQDTVIIGQDDRPDGTS